MLTDPISDLLIQIKNGYMARKKNVVVTHSNIKNEIAHLLSKEGYVGKVEVKNVGKVKKNISIDLVYIGKEPRLTDVVRVSKIARRIYAKKGTIPRVLSGLGMTILSTSSGLMTGKEARKKGLGGEIVCKVW
ncbi:30S ribosomal protein S8 [Candidatus Gottesmanbacteria bacterium]|nr:30S ribosomal protein S8 [Candidatus Gottesmanbacteria bacterium]